MIRKGGTSRGPTPSTFRRPSRAAMRSRVGIRHKPESLFLYDALVLANVDGSMLTRAQLDATRDFVSRRGGGLLVLGARSFLRQGLIDTSLEEALPLQLADRESSGVLPAAAARGLNRVSLTPKAPPIRSCSSPATPTTPASVGTPRRPSPRLRLSVGRGPAPASWRSRAAPADRRARSSPCSVTAKDGRLSLPARRHGAGA